MSSGMESMLDMYLFETGGLLEQLDGILLESEQKGFFSDEDINEIFRIMHTVKGSSAMMEFTFLMTVAHRLEDMFFIIRQNGVQAGTNERLFNIMFSGSDFLRSQVDNLNNGRPLDEVEPEVIGEIEAFLKVLNGEASADEPAKATESAQPDGSNTASGSPVFEIKVLFEEGIGMENLRAFMLVTSVHEMVEHFTFSPDDVETNSGTSSHIAEHGFSLYFNNDEDAERALSVVQGFVNIQEFELKTLMQEAPPTPEPEPTPEVVQQSATQATPPPVAAAPTPPPAAASVKQSLISVNLTKLDKLMNMVGEIVISESMVSSSPDLVGLKLDNFMKSARQLRKLTAELQEIVMSIRMVPVSGVFQKMGRIVRDMGQKLGKDVKLVTVGEDTEVDKTIVDGISDPVMHLVRNAMDHGIEADAWQRTALGKDSKGTITLTAQDTGSEVIIEISDDGKGIDPVTIMEKAKAKGLLTKAESEYSKKDILALIMAPGFSTKEQVTEFSGRGVGMDVVRKNVEEVGGIVSINSDVGKGSTVTFKIPLTLAIVTGLEVAVGSSTFTIPIHNVRQSFKAKDSDIVMGTDGSEMIYKMDELCSVVRLSQLYGIPSNSETIEDGIMIWLESSERSFCLFVDELVGEQQVVVKPIPAYLSRFNVKSSGIAGCTILGNGNISIILDVPELLNYSR